jgi:hypothetical protein
VSCLVNTFVANDNHVGLLDDTMFDAGGNLTNDTGVRSRIVYQADVDAVAMER